MFNAIGTIFAFSTVKNRILNLDKAKPRVIVGRKATGPDLGTAGLPKLKPEKPDYRGLIKW
jgi:hypothetical protein